MNRGLETVVGSDVNGGLANDPFPLTPALSLGRGSIAAFNAKRLTSMNRPAFARQNILQPLAVGGLLRPGTGALRGRCRDALNRSRISKFNLPTWANHHIFRGAEGSSYWLDFADFSMIRYGRRISPCNGIIIAKRAGSIGFI
jgi:hypothetical protein